ncbi:hypothetical protein MP228_003988 [Amoeboaphelidium protococcarum]|nr:hypothetical protein MP228_003988 [Amoeboaphelidium protococcarum]
MSKQRIVVLISGNGSNLQAIIDATSNQLRNIEIALVISSKASAHGLTRASEAGIPTLVHSLKSYKDKGLTRSQFDKDLADIILNVGNVQLVVMAGWMLIVSREFLDRLQHSADVNPTVPRVINLHPALPGEFSGVNAIQRAFDAQQSDPSLRRSGVMVHDVIEDVDMGKVVEMEEVEFINGESLEDFESRMHQAEHRVIVKAVQTCLQQSSTK